jgi:SulP family sulfate permease
MFALDYARVDIVRARLDGTCFHSSVERSAAARGMLAKKGKQILVYRLQGFVFFGTAVQLRDEIEERIRSASKGAIRHVLLDFSGVSGFDSSTMMTLVRFERLAFAHDFTLVLTGLKDEALGMLTRGGLTYGEGEPCHVLPDLDRGMEWCEDKVLAKRPKADTAAELMKELNEFFGEPAEARAFAKHLERVDFAAGNTLVKRNSKADEIYFFESGHARAQAELDDASTTRLRGFGPGSILGELAFFTGQRRSATVMATQDVRAWRLTREALEKMEKTDKPLAAAFYRALSAQFADRLSGTNRMLRFLVD